MSQPAFHSGPNAVGVERANYGSIRDLYRTREVRFDPVNL